MARFYTNIIERLPEPLEYANFCGACWDPDHAEQETQCVVAAKFPHTEWFKDQEIDEDGMGLLEVALREEDRKFSITDISAEYICPECGCAYMNYYSEYPNDLILNDHNYFESADTAYAWLEKLKTQS